MTGYSQSKSFVKSYDSTFHFYTNQILVKEKEVDGNEVLDPHNIDQEKLNASLFKALNELRSKNRRLEFNYDTTLDRLAYVYILNLNYHKFKPTAKSQNRMNKYLYLSGKRMGVNEGLIAVMIDIPYLLNYDEKREYFYNSTDTKTEYHLFYGNRSQLKDSALTPEPIAPFTYEEFGKDLSLWLYRSRQGKLLRTRSYSNMACWVLPIEKTITGKRIPRAKMIIVFSGKRLQQLSFR
ncbi:MAG: hypothetical protein CL840_11005 [Crocinitomicaceae bacterium]|nr:hypothetical protein [Crocinitomicaceae bacterium]